MTKAFKFFILGACCATMSVVCYYWTRAVAAECEPESFAPLFPVLTCVAFAVGALASFLGFGDKVINGD